MIISQSAVVLSIFVIILLVYLILLIFEAGSQCFTQSKMISTCGFFCCHLLDMKGMGMSFHELPCQVYSSLQIKPRVCLNQLSALPTGLHLSQYHRHFFNITMNTEMIKYYTSIDFPLLCSGYPGVHQSYDPVRVLK